MSSWLLTALNLVGLAALAAALMPHLGRARRAAALAVLVVMAFALVVVRRHAGQEPIEVQQLLNGLFLGSIYALIALGYTMVYGVLKLINFAHGEIFMIGAFVAYFTLSIYRHSPTPLALAVTFLLAMAVCAAVGVTIERIAYRPLRRAPRLAALITAIGVSLFLQNLGQLLVGAQPKTVPGVLPTDPLPGLHAATGLLVNLPNVVTVLASVILMVVLQAYVSRTRAGRAMRAVSEDREAAQLMGINVDAVIALTFIIGSALAGAGGVLWGIRYPSIKPDLGLIPGLKAFVAAVLGGIGSIPGAMIGGLLIGLIEVLVSGLQMSPVLLTQWLLFLLMMFCFWRLGDQYLPALGAHERGRWRRAAAVAALAFAVWVTAGLAAAGVAPRLSARAMTATLSGSTFRDAVVFVILIVILLVKPTGIMGRYAPEKV